MTIYAAATLQIWSSGLQKHGGGNAIWRSQRGVIHMSGNFDATIAMRGGVAVTAGMTFDTRADRSGGTHMGAVITQKTWMGS